MAAVGLDIGGAFIKVAQTDGNKLVMSGIANNPLGKLSPDTENEINQLAAAVKKMWLDKNISIKKVRVCISESAAYSRVISMPVLSVAELSNAIKYEAEQYIPISLEDVELSYEVIFKPTKKTGEEKMTVLLVAASKRTLNGIVEVLTKAALEPESIETELIASARVLVLEKNPTDVTMLVSIGAVSTGIAIFNQTNLLFTHRLYSGSAAMTRVIASSLSLPMLQAEEYKRSYGVRPDVLEGKLNQAVMPITTNLTNEIKKAYAFITTSNLTDRPTRVVLAGGGALVPGLVELISRSTGIETTIGEANIAKDNQVSNSLYVAAIGTSKR